ncbi:hypothetical protein Pmani_002894 [Petrolisthes manimaculis]|uniref:Uncharacterized protein n=1 Tax=Petrolisthes manimaculis TaxID=1843537 RepID=A0AAE1QGY3_9EUCA|nr:hypothetical protein Pmani_002894 [Petrolisthes manimaculis]
MSSSSSSILDPPCPPPPFSTLHVLLLHSRPSMSSSSSILYPPCPPSSGIDAPPRHKAYRIFPGDVYSMVPSKTCGKAKFKWAFKVSEYPEIPNNINIINDFFN